MKSDKTSRQLSAIGRQNLLHARRKIGSAWKNIEESKLQLNRLNQDQKLKPLLK